MRKQTSQPERAQNYYNSGGRGTLTLDPGLSSRFKSVASVSSLDTVNPHKQSAYKTTGSIKKICIYSAILISWIACMYVVASRTTFASIKGIQTAAADSGPSNPNIEN